MTLLLYRNDALCNQNKTILIFRIVIKFSSRERDAL